MKDLEELLARHIMESAEAIAKLQNVIDSRSNPVYDMNVTDQVIETMYSQNSSELFGSVQHFSAIDLAGPAPTHSLSENADLRLNLIQKGLLTDAQCHALYDL